MCKSNVQQRYKKSRNALFSLDGNVNLSFSSKSCYIECVALLSHAKLDCKFILECFARPIRALSWFVKWWRLCVPDVKLSAKKKLMLYTWGSKRFSGWVNWWATSSLANELLCFFLAKKNARNLITQMMKESWKNLTFPKLVFFRISLAKRKNSSPPSASLDSLRLLFNKSLPFLWSGWQTPGWHWGRQQGIGIPVSCTTA